MSVPAPSRAPAAWALALLLLCAGGTARAEGDHPLVRAGVAAYEALNYARAASLLERARRAALGPEERALALRTLGSAHVALGDEAAARRDFAELLELAPETKLGAAVSPKIRMVFEEVRAEQEARRAAAKEPAAPSPAPVAAPSGSAAPGAAPGSAPGAQPAPRVGATPAAPAQPPPASQAASSQPPPASPAASSQPPPASPAVPPATPSSAAPATPLPQGAVPAAQAAQAGGPAQPVPLYRRGWFWGVVGGVAGAAVLGGVLGGILGTREGQLVLVPR